MALLPAGPLWLSSAGVERNKNIPPRYAIRLDDLRAWHVVFATCAVCQKRTHIDARLLQHPGRHLLAEYETTVLERYDASPGHLSDLLARIERAILSLCTEGRRGPERLSPLHDDVSI